MQNKNKENKLWFKRKSYGWGWVPSSWEGWLVLAIYLLVVVKFSIFIHRGGDANLVVFLVPVVGMTAILIAICYIKGEKPKWTWGEDK